MKIKITSLFLVLILMACGKGEEQKSAESYRYELWKMFVDNEWEVDFVGTQIELIDHPNYLGRSFDGDHEGVGGIETEGVLQNLEAVLNNIETPNIVLLGVGGNDLLYGGDMPIDVIENIDEIIDVLQNYNPGITIFVERIAPPAEEYMTADFSRRLRLFNSGVRFSARVKSNVFSPVISVDMYSDFNDVYLIDGLHYNELGAWFIANKYFDAISNHFDPSEKLTILTLGDSRVQGVWN